MAKVSLRARLSETALEELTLLTAGEVVQLTKLSRATVYRLIAGGGLASIRIGKCVRVPLRELQRWMSANGEAGKKS